MFLFNIFLSTYLFCLYIAVCVVWIVVYFIQQLFLTHSVNKQSFKYVTIILYCIIVFNFNILSLKYPTLQITFVYSLKLISLVELFLLSSVVSALKKQSENIFVMKRHHQAAHFSSDYHTQLNDLFMKKKNICWRSC